MPGTFRCGIHGEPSGRTTHNGFVVIEHIGGYVTGAHRPFSVGIDDETFPPGLASIPAAGCDNIVIVVFFWGLISSVS